MFTWTYTTSGTNVYLDGELYETLEEFVEGEPQVEEIEELDAKVVEFKIKITGKNKNRRVYIRNGRLKKIREDESPLFFGNRKPVTGYR